MTEEKEGATVSPPPEQPPTPSPQSTTKHGFKRQNSDPVDVAPSLAMARPAALSVRAETVTGAAVPTASPSLQRWHLSPYERSNKHLTSTIHKSSSNSSMDTTVASSNSRSAGSATTTTTSTNSTSTQHLHHHHHHAPTSVHTTRSDELRKLKVALSRACNATQPLTGTVFVSGPPGTGKSTLLETFALSVPSEVIICRGKFEDLDRAALEPFAALIPAMDHLIRSVFYPPTLPSAASTVTPAQSAPLTPTSSPAVNKSKAGAAGTAAAARAAASAAARAASVDTLSPAENKKLWKERLQTGLGTELNFLQDMLPCLREILGTKRRRSSFAMLQVSADNDGFITTERDWGFDRWRLALRSLIRVVSKYRPVVLALDDMHWAERDSYEVIRTLIKDTHPGRRFLFVGTYQPVHAHHDLWVLMDMVHPKHMTNLRLGRQQSYEVKVMLEQRLKPKIKDVERLAEYVCKQSEGNYFSIMQMLHYMENQNYLRFADRPREWQWEMVPFLRAKNIILLPSSAVASGAGQGTDSIIERKIGLLDEKELLVLQTAACLGNSTFDVATIAQILSPEDEQDAAEGDHSRGIHSKLKYCIQALDNLLPPQRIKFVQKIIEGIVGLGLMYPMGGTGAGSTKGKGLGTDSTPKTLKAQQQLHNARYHAAGGVKASPQLYGFHDKVREAAYVMQDETTRKEFHLRIGRQLNFWMQSRQELGTFLEEALLFNAVHQLNLGSEMIMDRWERIDLVELNHDAAEVAALKFSFFPAVSYLQKGLEILGKDPWNEHYDLANKCFNALCRMQFCCARFNDSLETAEEIISQTKSAPDRKMAYRTKIMCMHRRKEKQAALDLTLTFLEELGHTLPRRGLKVQMIRNVVKTRRLVRGKSDKELMGIAVCKDNALNDAAEFMVNLGELADDGLNHDYLFLALLRVLQLTVGTGRIPLTPLCFAAWGYLMAQSGVFEEANHFGDLAMRYVGMRLGGRHDIRAKIFFHAFISHWSNPVKDSLRPMTLAISDLWKEGAMELVHTDTILLLRLSFLLGRPLKDLFRDVQRFAELLRDYDKITIYSIHAPFFQMIANLTGGSEKPKLLSGEFMDEEEQIQKWKASELEAALQVYYLSAAILALIFNDTDRAELMCEALAPDTEQSPDFLMPFRVFLRGAIGFQFARRHKSRKHRKQGEQALKHLNGWIQDGLSNCLHFRLILSALQASCNNGKTVQDLRVAWDDAIEQCGERGGFVNFEALANEMAGDVFVTRDEFDIASTYLSRARTLFQEWNCSAKVSQIHTRYSAVLDPLSESFRASSLRAGQNENSLSFTAAKRTQ